MVDATTATFSLGQFADDPARSRLRTLLAQQLPVEILMEKVSLHKVQIGVCVWAVWQRFGAAYAASRSFVVGMCLYRVGEGERKHDPRSAACTSTRDAGVRL